MVYGEDAPATSFVPEGYALTWSDEFDGDKLDRKKWGFPSYKQRGAAQLNSPGTVILKDGMLHLTTLWRDEKVHASYVTSHGRFKQRYGSIEIGNRGGIITNKTRLHAPLDVGRNVEAIEKAQRRRGGGGGGAADDGHGDGGHRHRGKAVQADPRLKAPSIKLSL